MLKLKLPEDCNQIQDESVRTFLKEHVTQLRNGEDGYYDRFPEFISDMPYDILIDNATDCVTKDVPHLNNSESGLYCLNEEGDYGWCWESCDYHPKIKLFEIVICMNDSLCVGYWVPDDDHIDPTLKSVLCSKLNIGESETDKGENDVDN